MKTPDLTMRQAEELFERLAPAAKIRLVRRLSPALKIQLVRSLEQETWPERFRQLLAQIDRRVRQHPQRARTALNSVGPARRAFYAARRRRH